MMNLGAFDYEGWLLQNHIFATGYIRDDPGNLLLKPDGMALSLVRGRQFIVDRLDSLLADNSYKGIIEALAIGERAGISDSQWQTLRQTGTSHLIAISGLHIGLVAVMGFVLASRCWSLFPTLLQRLPAQAVGAICSLLCASTYAALAGFTIPTQRAVVMITVLLLASLLRRHQRPSDSIAMALLAVLVVDPLAPLSGGFWLSFGAVMIIFYGMGGRLVDSLKITVRWWWRWGRLHLLLSLGLAPLLIILFQQVPLLSSLANVLAVPWVSLIVVPVILAGMAVIPASTAIAEGLFRLADMALSLLWPLLDKIGSYNYFLWQQYRPPDWFLISAITGTVILLLPRGIPGRWVGLVWLAPALFSHPRRAMVSETKARSP